MVNARLTLDSQAVSSSTKSSAFETGSHFSGNHDTQIITYNYCPDEQGHQGVYTCRDTITAHSVYSGSLDKFNTIGELDHYRPTPGDQWVLVMLN